MLARFVRSWAKAVYRCARPEAVVVVAYEVQDVCSRRETANFSRRPETDARIETIGTKQTLVSSHAANMATDQKQAYQ